MTYSEAIARGYADSLELFLRVDGSKYVLGTSEDAPTDSWFTDGGFDYLRGLRRDSINMQCRAHMSEVWPDAPGFDIQFDDKAYTLAAYLKSRAACGLTMLAADMTTGSTSATVGNTGGISAGDDVYIEQETIGVGAVDDGTTISSLTRGKYGSVAKAHKVDLNLYPPLEPELLSGPSDLLGRRCIIYGAEVTNGALSATEQLWIGYVSAKTRIGPGRVTIPVTPMISLFAKGDALGWVPTGRLNGLWVPNIAGASGAGGIAGMRWGRLLLREADGTHNTIDVVADGSAQWFADSAALVAATRSALDTAAIDFELSEMPDGRLRLIYSGSGSFDPMLGVGARLQQLLGFVDEDLNNTGGVFEEELIAAVPPAEVFAPLEGMGTVETRLYLRDGEADWFVESRVRVEASGEDDGFGLVPVTDVDTTNDYLVVTPVLVDGTWWPSHVVCYGNTPAPAIRQTWSLDANLCDVVRALWTGDVYEDGWALSYTTPDRWLPAPALHVDDVDWTSFRTLVWSYVPANLQRMLLNVTEPTPIADLLTGHLVACGLYATIANDGRVVFCRARIPSVGEATASIDSSCIDGRRCTGIDTQVSGEAIMNACKLQLPDGSGSWDDENLRDVYTVDQNSLLRYGEQLARNPLDPLQALRDSARELRLYVHPDVVTDVVSLEQEISDHMRQTAMAVSAWPRSTVRLPVSPKARQHAIGDVVSVTSVWIWDTFAGQMGVTNKLAMVVGYSRPNGRRAIDQIDLMLVDETYVVIAPCAHADSFVAASATLTCSDTSIYKSSDDYTDLDHFEAGDAIRMITHDDDSPATWTGTILSVDTVLGTITLTANEFAVSGFPANGVRVVFGDYSDATTDQRSEGWAWIGDDTDGQIEDLVDAHEVAP